MSGNQRVRVNLGPAEVDVDGYRRDGRSLTLWWKDFDGSVHVVQPAGHFIHEPEPEPVGAPDA